LAAVARGRHRLEDPQPWVLDDSFALSLVGALWPDILTQLAAVFREPLIRQASAGAVVRSRYAEDRLINGSFSQYVILGAGLDSFAWRRPDLLRSLRVFEIDHPATQAWKQERRDALALSTSEQHVFAPVDFEIETLHDGLSAAGFDWSRPTLFSWLGVVFYLTDEAIQATLRTVASCAAGSEIVFTYMPTPSFLDDIGREFVDTFLPMVAHRGEPVQTLLAPTDAEALVAGCGLKISDHPTRDDLHDRYFANRTDDLTPWTVERLITAVVPG
jgi:methyltransferase (TIGR00027 family)